MDWNNIKNSSPTTRFNYFLQYRGIKRVEYKDEQDQHQHQHHHNQDQEREAGAIRDEDVDLWEVLYTGPPLPRANDRPDHRTAVTTISTAFDRFQARFQQLHEDLEISFNDNDHNGGGVDDDDDDGHSGGINESRERLLQAHFPPMDDNDSEDYVLRNEGNDGNEGGDNDHDSDENDPDAEEYFFDDANEDELYQRPNDLHPVDADLFYTDQREPNDTDIEEDLPTNDHIHNVDKNFQYVRARRSSHVTSISQKMIRRSSTLFVPGSSEYPHNSQSGYDHWERHTPSAKPPSAKPPSSTTVYHSFAQHVPPQSVPDSPPQFKDQFNSFDPFSLLIDNTLLSQQFTDSLNLKPLGIETLFQIHSLKKYKNNLCTVIRNLGTNEDFLVIGYNSDILVYDFNLTTNLPNKFAILKFDTKPSFTTTTDRLISTWPYFPHTVNFITKFDNFLGSEGILCVCCDDGTLLIYDIKSIMKKIDELGSKRQKVVDPTNVPDNKVHLKPQFKLRLDASIWGLDFKRYDDNHNVFVVSDNSQSLTLLYYHELDHRFYHVKSHQLLHNIPECAIISITVNQPTQVHTVKVSCGSISGELIIFQFRFKLQEGPLNFADFNFYKDQEYYYIDAAIESLENRNNINFNNTNVVSITSSKFSRVVFTNPVVTLRTVLNEYCWTTKVINSKYFKMVNSINELTGDFSINSNSKSIDIINESKILNLEFDPVQSSHLGLAADWQHLECKTINLSKLSHATMTLSPSVPNINDSSTLSTLDDEYKRIHKGLLSQFNHLKARPQQRSINNQCYLLDVDKDLQSSDFLVVSTGKRIGLFRSDTLFCNSSTKTMFDLSIPSNDQSKPSNRISITQIIPQLQCFIAITQQGLISIMRLCQYRGLFAMRQEYVFPNAIILALANYGGYRTIAGFSTRDKSISPQYPRFLLYIIYTDGFVLSYELSLHDDNDELLVTCL